MIPYHISFSTPSWLFSYPCQAKGPVHPFELLDVFFVCAHQLHIEFSCNLEILGTAGTSFPQQFSNTRDECFIHPHIFVTVRDVNGHHESGFKETVVHLSSNLHDLVIWQNSSETNNVTSPFCFHSTHIHTNPGQGHPRMEKLIGICARMRTSSRSFSAISEMFDEHWRYHLLKSAARHQPEFWLPVQPYVSAVS